MFPEYEEPLFRPPCEAGSLIIQVALGCPHNACTFCAMYKMKKYRVREVEEVKADLRKARLMYSRVPSIFLADGNTIAMNSDKLAGIIAFARDLFPEAERVSSYGGARFLKGKPPEALARLKEAGLDIIYLGLETGDDEILRRINKGVTSDDMVEAARRVKQAGIQLSAYVLLGIGGMERWEQHGLNTALTLNRMQPDFIRPRTFYPVPATELWGEIARGEFTEADGETVMHELKLMLENLDVEGARFLSDHISNYVPIHGLLNRDREEMLATIEMALASPGEHLGPRHLTSL